jgi:hypothetical protein
MAGRQPFKSGKSGMTGKSTKPGRPCGQCKHLSRKYSDPLLKKCYKHQEPLQRGDVIVISSDTDEEVGSRCE